MAVIHINVPSDCLSSTFILILHTIRYTIVYIMMISCCTETISPDSHHKKVLGTQYKRIFKFFHMKPILFYIEKMYKNIDFKIPQFSIVNEHFEIFLIFVLFLSTTYNFTIDFSSRHRHSTHFNLDKYFLNSYCPN